VNIAEIKIPTLQQLQTLFPLGPLELDQEAMLEVRSAYAFRNLFTRLVEPEATEGVSEVIDEVHTQLYREEEYKTTQQSSNLKAEGPQRQVSISAVRFYGRCIETIAGAMRSESSPLPGLRLAIYDVLNVLEHEAGETIHARAAQYTHAFGAILSQMPQPAIPVPMIQCTVYAVLKAVLRDIVMRFLYRKYPEIRFPWSRLIVIDVDVPDDSSVLVATITGYQVPLLSSLQPQQLPDIVDSSMFEKKGPQ
jgi:hypothetical protein